jgi:uncharacterized protein (TIGR00297 family)
MENIRQILHIAMIAPALLLRWLPGWAVILCAVGGLVAGLIGPRLPGGHSMLRPAEEKKKFSYGVFFYPLSVFFLVIFLPRELAGGVWAIIALGDGFSNLVGRWIGKSNPLPWNPKKSWAGMIAFWIFGSAGSISVMMFISGEMPLAEAMIICIPTAILCGLVETINTRIDDNLSVAAAGGFSVKWISVVFITISMPVFPMMDLGIGVLVNIIASILSMIAGLVNLTGAVFGSIIGITIYTFLGWKGFMCMLVFFVIGSVASKHKYSYKAKIGVAESKKGRRSHRNAIANCSLGAILAFLCWGYNFPPALILAFIGSFAAALSDTTSSELGQVYGKNPRMITTWKPARVGMDGAVTVAGTVLGIVCGTLLGAVAFACGLFTNPVYILYVMAAAALGTTVDSFLGATLEQRGNLSNEEVNFLCTVTGALTAYLCCIFIPL